MTFFQGFYDPENLNTRDPRMENQKHVRKNVLLMVYSNKLRDIAI